MKKIVLIAATAVLLVACQKKEKTTLILDPVTTTFEAAGGEKTFSLSSNDSWAITTDGADWYKVSPLSGSGDAVITIKAEAYIEAAGRSSQITVTAGDLIQTFAVIQKRPAVPSDPGALSYRIRSYEQDLEIPVPAGFAYEVVLPNVEGVSVKDKQAQAFTLHFDANTTSKEKKLDISVQTTDKLVIETASVTQSWKNIETGEILIEEIFFSGNLIPDSNHSDSGKGDQYLKLTNVTSETLYADGMMIIMGHTHSQKAAWVYPTLTAEIPAGDLYVIPGKGKEVALPAGQSLILALAAQDFSKDNPNGFNLSKANFEFYDDNDIYPDVDNPDVPNLILWYKSSRSITSFHGRGFESYAIAVAPFGITVESFMEAHKWEGIRTFDFNGHHFEQEIKDVYLVPNEWVIDGVNCAIPENLGTLVWNARIDAGYTNVSKVDKDPERYGKSVRRTKGANGQFVDTDNSTNDFEMNLSPTVK